MRVMQVHLREGVRASTARVNETCTAGAGSLVLELGLLSRLLDDPTYEAAARRAQEAVFRARSNVTGTATTSYFFWLSSPPSSFMQVASSISYRQVS